MCHLNPWPPANKYGLQAESLDMKYPNPEPGIFGEWMGILVPSFRTRKKDLQSKKIKI